MTKTKKTEDKKVNFLLSSDTLSWFGLDLIFESAKLAWFDWLDLALWKNFDSWNITYVKKLVKKHDLPIFSIQVSGDVNKKEMDKALELCEELSIKSININAPVFFNFRTYSFLKDNLRTYISSNPDITFSIINPEDSNYFIIPIPKYRFNNIVEIIKKYWTYLALDISNLNEWDLEADFFRKIDKFIPYLSTVYFSDKTKLGKWHVMPGDWVLKLTTLLKRMKKDWYKRSFTVKLNISKQDLADSDKVELILKKARSYFLDNFDNVVLD